MVLLQLHFCCIHLLRSNAFCYIYALLGSNACIVCMYAMVTSCCDIFIFIVLLNTFVIINLSAITVTDLRFSVIQEVKAKSKCITLSFLAFF